MKKKKCKITRKMLDLQTMFLCLSIGVKWLMLSITLGMFQSFISTSLIGYPPMIYSDGTTDLFSWKFFGSCVINGWIGATFLMFKSIQFMTRGMQ